MDARQYLTKAQEAEAMANAANQPADRAHWETIAREWRRLAKAETAMGEGKSPIDLSWRRFEVTMHEYEIRLLSFGQASIIVEEVHLNHAAAIRAARKMSHGRPFEVWRGLECISGVAELPKPSASTE
jgi:hypothetical protein